MDNAEHVANDNHHHKKGAFAYNNLRAQRFHNGNGPTAGEAQQHQYFPNAKSTHKHQIYFVKKNDCKSSKLSAKCFRVHTRRK